MLLLSLALYLTVLVLLSAIVMMEYRRSASRAARNAGIRAQLAEGQALETGRRRQERNLPRL